MHQKSIPNDPEMSSTLEISKNPKCIRNITELPISLCLSEPILTHITSFTPPPPITAPCPQFLHFNTSQPPQRNQFCKMQMAANH